MRGLVACGMTSAVFSVVMSTHAFAAEPQPAPVNWTGFYVGAHAGGVWSKYRLSDSTLGVTENANVNRGSWLAGGQIGYNWQFMRNWVVGAEADFSFTDLGGTAFTDPIPALAGLGFPVTVPVSVELRNMGTVRVRLGYAFDRTLLYATGGMAWARDNASYVFFPGLVQMDAHLFHLGWAAGAGAEYAIDPHWSVRAEYLHADFGRVDETFISLPRTTALKADLVRLGLNYRFGAPMTARSTLPVKAPPRAVAGRWTGAYVGGNVGYAWGRFNLDDEFDPNFPVSVDPKGWLGGIQLGYNNQFYNNIIIGLEADQSFGSVNASVLTPANLVNPVFDETTSVHLNQFGSARARIGLAWNDVFAYVTGGLAWTHVEFSETSINGTDAGRKEYRLGPTIGGGVEVALDPNWSVKAEYLHADFGTSRDVVFDISLPVNYSLKMDVVRAGFNYRFGG